MGARLGFEVIQALRRSGAPAPLRFYAAAALPPDVDDPVAHVATLDDQRCVARLIELVGSPTHLRDNPELRELLLPVLRSDLNWLRNSGRPEAPLAVPIVAIAGDSDSLYSAASMDGWRRHTTAGFQLRTVPGGHFFPQATPGEVVRLITEDLLPDGAGSGGPRAHRATPTPVPTNQNMSPQPVPHTELGTGCPTSAPSREAPAHLIQLPGTDWLLWRQALLRTAGFPARGLDRFSAPDCARAADAFIDACAEGGVASDRAATAGGAFAEAFVSACATGTREAHDIAGQPLFREAVTWQSRSVMHALDAIRAAGPAAQRTRKQRERERIIARYWQRYCAKAETIGFFGPVCWIGVEPGGRAVTAAPGASLLRQRRVFLEHWALEALADEISAQPGVRTLIAPALQPHLYARDGVLYDPHKSSTCLTRAEAALIARCDGRTPACDIARELSADGSSGLRSPDDAYLLAADLAERGVLRWKLDIPVNLSCEQELRDRLSALPGDQARSQALAGLDKLSAARDEVAAAAGDPDALAGALDRLDVAFTAATGKQPGRHPGRMYVGRGLCWEESVRDLDVTVGGPVLERIAKPMAVLLQACRWVSATMTAAYLQALQELYQEMAAEAGSGDVPLGPLWFLAQGLFYGTAGRPADQVASAFAQRWQNLFGLDRGSGWSHQVEVSSAEADERAERLFPAAGPGWSSARLHAPDLQLCAESVAAINQGNFTAVLGEMHVAWATCTCGVFVCGHPRPEDLRADLGLDLGTGRLTPLLPTDWPRNTARLAFALQHPSDVSLGFAPAPGADPRRLVPISSMSVTMRDGGLFATAADGRRWPLPEVFDRQLSEVCVEAFKRTDEGVHTPRLLLGDLVVARETWRSTVRNCSLATVTGDRERYLAARAWRRELDLPDRVFLKIGTETKPVFVDLTSPLYVSSAATMIRAARLAAGGSDVPLTITEVLPDVSQAWVPDAAGDRYVSELRLQFRDPRPVQTPLPGWPT